MSEKRDNSEKNDGIMPTVIQFIRFNVVGVINTLIDWVVFWVMSMLGLHFVAAKIISYSCGLLQSYCQYPMDI